MMYSVSGKKIILVVISKKVYVFQLVMFQSNSLEIDSSEFYKIDSVVVFYKEHSHEKLKLVGYSDNVGLEKNNIILSENRAKSIYDYVINKGLSSENVSYQGRRGRGYFCLIRCSSKV